MSRVERHLNHGDGLTGTNVPKIIVVHSMAEFIKNPEPVHAIQFLNEIGLSAHSLISPDGVNYRCRNDNEFAYHAKGYNTSSLGIEFLVSGGHDYASFIGAIKRPYVSDEQYQAGLYQVREWLNLYDIEKVVRHSDLSPGRKVDPGYGFPWHGFIHDLGV